MDKEVVISIKGMQKYEGTLPDVVELVTAGRLAREGIDRSLWDRLKKAAYGSMVRRLNSLDDTCFELAQAHFDGEDYLSFPQVFQSIERSDGEELIRSWCTEDRVALSVIRPLD